MVFTIRLQQYTEITEDSPRTDEKRHTAESHNTNYNGQSNT